MYVSAPEKGITADINVLPLIDVLLVLIVIFLMLQRIRYGADVQLPPAESHAAAADQVVLEIDARGDFSINRQPVTESTLAPILVAAFQDRPRKLLFIKAHGNRSYQEVIHAIDIAKLAGVQVIAMVPKTGQP